MPSSPEFTILDTFLGLLYLVTFLVGVPGNILASLYFRRRTGDLPSLLFFFTSLNDTFLCCLHLFSGISLLNGRAATLFGYPTFCTSWDISHFVTVKLSVMLVLMISLDRAWAFLRPLRINSRCNKCLAAFLLVFYFLLIVGMDVMQRVKGYGESVYIEHDAYCWMNPTSNSSSSNSSSSNSTSTLSNSSSNSTSTLSNHPSSNSELSEEDPLINFYVFGCALLALPVIPVAIACLVTVIVMERSLRLIECSTNVLKRRATFTTLIFASVYLIFNIPLFINYITWTSTILTNSVLYEKIYLYNDGMYMYIWNLTDVLSVSLNSMMNPIIYFWRISRFNRWVRNIFRTLAGKNKSTKISRLRSPRIGALSTFQNSFTRQSLVRTTMGHHTISSSSPMPVRRTHRSTDCTEEEASGQNEVCQTVNQDGNSTDRASVGGYGLQSIQFSFSLEVLRYWAVLV